MFVNKVLSCDPKGESQRKRKPTELDLDLHYLTKLTETFYTHSSLQKRKAMKVFLRGGIRGCAQFAHTTRRDATPDVTKTHCVKKNRLTGRTMVQSTDQTQQISVPIGYVQQLNTYAHTHTSCVPEMEHFFKKQRDPPGFFSVGKAF